MGIWDGFDYDSWEKDRRRPWWQRLHIYLTGNDPWDDDDKKPPSSGGGGGYGGSTNHAIRTASIAGGIGGV